MEKEVKERMKEVLAYYKTTPTEVSKGNGNLQKRFSSQVFQGKRMSFDTFNEFLRIFPNISSDWLVTGTGNMFKVDTVNSVDLHRRLGKLVSLNFDVDNEKLQFYINELSKLCTACELEPRKPMTTYDDARAVWKELSAREHKSFLVLTKHSYTGPLKSIWIVDD